MYKQECHAPVEQERYECVPGKEDKVDLDICRRGWTLCMYPMKEKKK